jgi:hypothetical protein
MRVEALYKLAEEAPMSSIPTMIGVLSCGFLLNLGISNVAQVHAASTADSLKAEQTERRQGPVGKKYRHRTWRSD